MKTVPNQNQESTSNSEFSSIDQVIKDNGLNTDSNVDYIIMALARMKAWPSVVKYAGITKSRTRFLCCYQDAERLIDDMTYILRKVRSPKYTLPYRLKELIKHYEKKVVLARMQNGLLHFIELNDMPSHNTTLIYNILGYYDDIFITDSAICANLCWSNLQNAIFIDPSTPIKFDDMLKLRLLLGDQRVYIVTGRERLTSLKINNIQEIIHNEAILYNGVGCYEDIMKIISEKQTFV
ncbi:hypothetical protein [Vibrio alginolyticus]|uniref:Uncharacterized protein n=1 Tax=Vibrio alginolyticus TaxID=663 RepID=A0A7Y4EX44_VIBAL|nr:hypothetical protein [Vibrio alginolyticus]NOI07375.1 hypothetical protein [Vibrio alginolyticus]